MNIGLANIACRKFPEELQESEGCLLGKEILLYITNSYYLTKFIVTQYTVKIEISSDTL